MLVVFGCWSDQLLHSEEYLALKGVAKMNIFATDLDPEISAQNLCDKHVVKMILESAQILSTAHTSNGPPLYRNTHERHPCVLWVRESIQNYRWLCEHALSLCKEYTFRYGRTHKSEKVIVWCIDNLPCLPDKRKISPFFQAIPEKYRGSSPVEAYRKYYIGDKSRFAKWNKGRNPPIWFVQGESHESKS